MITFTGMCYRSSHTAGETCLMMMILQTMKVLPFRYVQIWMIYSLDFRRRKNVFIRRAMKAVLSSLTNCSEPHALREALFARTADFDDRHHLVRGLPSSRRPVGNPFTVGVTWPTCLHFRYTQNVHESSPHSILWQTPSRLFYLFVFIEFNTRILTTFVYRVNINFCGSRIIESTFNQVNRLKLVVIF